MNGFRTVRMVFGLGPVIAILLGTVTHAVAEGIPESRPPLSPYLNQLRGMNPAVNYYFGKAAERRQTSQPVKLGAPVGDGRPMPFSPPDGGPIANNATGHAVQFMNMTPFFNFVPAASQRLRR